MSSGIDRLNKINECIENIEYILNDSEIKILEKFTSEDLKGISSVRNYIAHDYDSTDDNIIEDVLRYNLPIFKDIIEQIQED